ncbi:MAG TPA: hypothetical protein VHL58_02550 [Thermoanaerobaculia bacterium]|nr:hypothetical protein [Thermoanaerobaculia bacterium]
MWPLRLAIARLRPWTAGSVVRILIVLVTSGAFLYGDYRVSARLFAAVADIEALSPFFSLGLVANFLELVMLACLSVLFFSAMTSSIGAFFTDLDLELYHAAPRRLERLLLGRFGKTYLQSSYAVLGFLTPMLFALGRQYGKGVRFFVATLLDLAVFTLIPVALGSILILLLVRYFPIGRVQQIAATLAIIAFSIAVIALRMSRPERLFQKFETDDLVRILRAMELPARKWYPSSWLARHLIAIAEGSMQLMEWRLLAVAAISVALFFLTARQLYFRAFVRSRESSAPAAIGGGTMVAGLERLLGKATGPVRAIILKEVRVVTREAAQWSQFVMFAALIFIYLYNLQTLPLEGDARSFLVSYLNLGMAGFVVAAVCLRFAYPSLSTEGRSYWIVSSAPVSFSRFLLLKSAIYLFPMLVLTLLLISAGNLMLGAGRTIWLYTIPGGALMCTTLVVMGIGMGAIDPEWKNENAIEVALSIGGFTYMGLSMLYVGGMMLLVARPMHRILLKVLLGLDDGSPLQSPIIPLVTCITVSTVLCVVPMALARWSMIRRMSRG